MNCLPNKFIKVTDHYGYLFEENCRGMGPLYVVYRVSDTRHMNSISGYILRAEAIKSCKYLEHLNSEKFSKESNQ